MTGPLERDDEAAAGVLLAMTGDAHPAVRRGGCYGLPGLLHCAGVVDALQALEETDPDADVRLAAALVRHGFGEATC